MITKQPLQPLYLLLLLLLFSTSIFIPISSFNPTTSFFLNCGSSSTTTLPKDNPSRDFKPDADFITSFSSSSSPSLTNPNPSPSSSPLYTTARVFTQTSSYQFPIATAGTYVLRLHFFPFSTTTHDLTTANFNVSALQEYFLLGDFSPPSVSNFTIQEYFLWVDTSVLEITFTPNTKLAFVNAVEVFSAPAVLVDDSVPTYLASLGNGGRDDQFSRQAFQTVYRINVGGELITPANDTLWRTWIPDDDYLFSKSEALKNSSSQKITYYTDPRRTPEVAPDSVYRTARTMNILPIMRSGNPNFNFNLTWSFPVSSGYQYFVRMHFCNFITEAVDELFFDVYIGSRSAYKDLQPGSFTGHIPAAAFYQDFVADPEDGSVNVSVGRSKMSNQWNANALLNGVEIIKISNSVRSLDGLYNPHFGLSNSKRKIPLVLIIVGSSVAGVAIIILSIIVPVFFCKKKRKKSEPAPKPTGTLVPWFFNRPSNRTISSSIENSSGGGGGGVTRTASPRVNLDLSIPLANIKLATNDFDEVLVIGSGGFGKVYRGVLADGTMVAVKRAMPGSHQGYPEFRNEITVLSQIQHRHLVTLVGYCDEMSEMILVYEYMEKGTLKSYLYGSELPCLSWEQRLRICIGAGRGVDYLHTGHSHAIIHRDIKSTNILLGEDYLAKVSDFGLSKLGPSLGETHVSTGVKGSFGYLDPEYFKMQKLTIKSDVYSLGVLLFEVLCARPVIDPMLSREELNLAEWALHWQRKGQLEKVIDRKIAGKVNPNSLRKFGETAERCLAEYGVDRPTVADVLWNLEYALQLQETELIREPHEDSVTVDPGIQSLALRRLPSTCTTMDGDDVYSDVSASKVFSQLINDGGR